DALSKSTTYSYDAVGDLTRVVYPSRTNSYAYDALSRLTNKVDNIGTSTYPYNYTYAYDAGNRLQTLSSPAGAFTYTFKGPGNVVTNLALPSGVAITNAFDSMARMSGTWLKKSDGTVVNSHTYGYNFASQRTVMTNSAGNYLNYTYDKIGELKTAK